MTALVYLIFSCVANTPCVSVDSLGVFPTRDACIAQLVAMSVVKGRTVGHLRGRRLSIIDSDPRLAYECHGVTVPAPPGQ